MLQNVIAEQKHELHPRRYILLICRNMKQAPGPHPLCAPVAVRFRTVLAMTHRPRRGRSAAARAGHRAAQDEMTHLVRDDGESIHVAAESAAAHHHGEHADSLRRAYQRHGAFLIVLMVINS